MLLWVDTYIGVELVDEAGEVVVPKVGWEEPLREIQRVENYEAVVVGTRK